MRGTLTSGAATTHPWTLTVWVLLSSVFVGVMDWTPKPEFGILGYLKPLPAFAAMALPLVFLIDWYFSIWFHFNIVTYNPLRLQRPVFNDRSLEVLKRPDMVEMDQYYSRSPSSGFWLLELGQTFVGMIAIDASQDALSRKTVEEGNAGNGGRSRKFSKGTSDTVMIRHFYVVEAYRRAGAQDDLLEFALQHAFKKSKTVQRTRATPSPFMPYLGQALKKAGFTVIEQGPKVGFIASKPTLTYELTRDRWEEMQQGE